MAFPPRSDPRLLRDSCQVARQGKIIMALQTRSDVCDVLRCRVFPLSPVLGSPHLPALRNILGLRLGDELVDDLGR